MAKTPAIKEPSYPLLTKMFPIIYNVSPFEENLGWLTSLDIDISFDGVGVGVGVGSLRELGLINFPCFNNLSYVMFCSAVPL